jgi:hypothetical protein
MSMSQSTSRIVAAGAVSTELTRVDTDSSPIFNPKPFESAEVRLVPCDEHQVIDARDGSNLTVDKRGYFSGGLESHTLVGVPLGRSAVVVQDRKAAQHNMFQEPFDRFAATRRRKTCTSEQ